MNPERNLLLEISDDRESAIVHLVWMAGGYLGEDEDFPLSGGAGGRMRILAGKFTQWTAHDDRMLDDAIQLVRRAFNEKDRVSYDWSIERALVVLTEAKRLARPGTTDGAGMQ